MNELQPSQLLTAQLAIDLLVSRTLPVKMSSAIGDCSNRKTRRVPPTAGVMLDTAEIVVDVECRRHEMSNFDS